MKKHGLLFLFLISLFTKAQTTTNTWAVKLSSHVERRTWKLTYKSEKNETSLGGASLVLTKQGKVVLQSTTDSNGDFTMMIPPNDVFILTVSYPGCNPKRITIITTGVPEDLQKDNYHPSFEIIGGFIMAKPFPGINYTGLQEPLVKVVYFPKLKNFDDDPEYTEYGTGIVTKIKDAEQILIDKFCGLNKQGDAALAIPDCPLAKRLYNEAIATIPGEEYPVIQLAKVSDCLKQEEEKKKAEEAKKAAEEKAIADKAKAAEEAKKVAGEKAAAEKANKDKAASEKAEANKLAKEKTAAEKEAKAKALAEKEAADKQAKANAAKKKPVPENKMPGDEGKEKKGDFETKSKEGEPVIGHGDNKYRKPQVLAPNKYKDAINKADGFFKMKRWAEAKPAYEEVLKIKPDDAYATAKLAEVNKFLSK